ncbi:MAG: hypothetical protein U5K00_02080 [Melioribacteraceae bacterium]|nr:hypothetical protein [Melioribacteraceae bacterium]
MSDFGGINISCNDRAADADYSMYFGGNVGCTAKFKGFYANSAGHVNSATQATWSGACIIIHDNQNFFFDMDAAWGRKIFGTEHKRYVSITDFKQLIYSDGNHSLKLNLPSANYEFIDADESGEASTDIRVIGIFPASILLILIKHLLT